jgi:hypothetical protein
VRPPDVVDGGVLREFAKSRREWWALPSEMSVGDVGQANLLQAQVSDLPRRDVWTFLTRPVGPAELFEVYDDCVQNQVYFFVVTNLKQWVFGTFVSAKKSGGDSGRAMIDVRCRIPITPSRM